MLTGCHYLVVIHQHGGDNMTGYSVFLCFLNSLSGHSVNRFSYCTDRNLMIYPCFFIEWHIHSTNKLITLPVMTAI